MSKPLDNFEQSIDSKLTEREFVKGTVSPLWLGRRFLDIIFTQDIDYDVKEIQELLDEENK